MHLYWTTNKRANITKSGSWLQEGRADIFSLTGATTEDRSFTNLDWKNDKWSRATAGTYNIGGIKVLE